MLRQILHKLIGKSDDNSSKGIAVKSLTSFSMTVASTGLAFVIGLVLTHLLGDPKLYGDYVWAFSWVNLLVLLSLLGFDKLVVREFPKLRKEEKWGALKGVYRWSGSIVFLFAVLLALAAYGVSLLPLKAFADTNTRTAFQLAIIAIPIYALSQHRMAALVGIKQVVLGQFPEKIVRPGTMLLATTILYLVAKQLNISSAVLLNLGAIGITFVFGQWLLSRYLKKHQSEPTSKATRNMLLMATIPLWMFNISGAIHSKADILMLGSLMDTTREAGIYHIAFTLTTMVNFILIAFNTVLAPSISELSSKEKYKELQTVLVKSARIILLLSIPISLTLIFGRNFFLGLFGTDYTEGGTALIILCVAQLVNVLTASVGNVLIMTRHVKWALAGLWIGLTANLILNAVLIPKYGMEGAAWATGIGIVCNNVSMLIFVLVKLKINPTAFGKTYK